MPPFPTSRFLMLAGGAVISNRNFKMHHHHNISLCDAKKSFDDCMNPACKSTLDLIKMMNMKHKMKSVPKAVESPPPQEAINPYTPLGCPADRDILGQGTWQLIHTIAANYPPEPTKEQKQNTFSFLQSLSKVYPCPYCAADFQARLVDHPPKLETREEFVLWCCELHNHVNEKLSKPVFPCRVSELDARWKDGRDECWEGKGEEVDGK